MFNTLASLVLIKKRADKIQMEVSFLIIIRLDSSHSLFIHSQ